MILERKLGFYEKYTKRILDIICSALAIIVFSWLYVVIALLVRLKLGSPIIFKQPRPGLIDPKTGQERIFYMYKFRTMTDEKDDTGKLKPDTERLTPFGKKLRGTSLDELPEVFNILKGDMSIIGPRPQLVRDMVFMSDEQRMRHTARPGLSGLAQVMGRNAISWEDKLAWDLKYIEHVSFWGDLKLILLTAKKVFGREESKENVDLTDDYGDALLKAGKVSNEKYDALQIQAQQLLAGC
ncbi:MAG: sugar transferase [Synergistaceae bacterium]|nr:sugar transferase [Synergistaceae bacterium]